MRNIILYVLVTGMLVACSDQTLKQQTMATSNTTDTIAATREKNLGVIKSFFDLLHRKNAAAWAELWDENGFIYIPYPVANFPDTIKTRKTIQEGFEHLLAGFKSFDYHIK